jgi:4-hydroxymandelate oxidase
MNPDPEVRRQLLRFLAASPLAAGLAPWLRAAGATEGARALSEVLSVMDLEPLARGKIPPAHFAYLATGVDDDATLRANREGFARIAIRVRRLVDVSRIDTSVTLFGTSWPTPIVLAPVGSQAAFHPDGETATAKAARAKGNLQILSTVSSTAVEDVNAARGEPVWYQLYPTEQWSVTRGLVARARAAGCPVLVLTVDLQGGSNRETLARGSRLDDRNCLACHDENPLASITSLTHKPMLRGLDVSRVQELGPMEMTWEYLERLRGIWPGRLVVKGIVTREDAELAVGHGVDGLVVSNHGGRAEESGRASIESLPEVVEGVKGRVPVLVDGGIRRGTDIFKALALGATAVAIGRPYIWGLGAFGQEGVETVLEILHRELITAMRHAGTPRVANVTRSYLADAPRR